MNIHVITMFAAGVGIPVLAALNAALGRHVGAPAVAAVALFLVALAVACVVAGVTAPGGFAKLASAPRHLFLGGVLIAFYVLSVTWIAPIIGLGNAIFLVLMGQLVAAAVIDHFGLFTATVTPLTWTRAAGLGLMAAGLFVTQKV